MMSGATIQARPVAYMTAEGAMSANFMFPPAPIFGPPQYFSGRGNRGDSVSPFQFVNPNQPYAPIDFTGYPPGYGNVPFSESKPIIHDTQEAAAKALLSLQNSSSGTTTSHSSVPTTMAATSRLAGFITEDQTPDLISALRQSTAFGPGETINAAGGLDPRAVSCASIDYHHPDIKPINLIPNVAHVVTTDATHTTSVTGINGMAERSPTANKPRPKSKSGNNICQICGKSYARPSTLKTHLRTHSGEKPYRCDICGKAFTQAANLTAHLRTHSGEKPFSCPICQKRFSQSSSVTTHLRTHSGERPYRCDFCGKCFADTSTLTKHKRIHSGEKPYRCKICNLGFSQSGNLHRHMKTHNNN